MEFTKRTIKTIKIFKNLIKERRILVFFYEVTEGNFGFDLRRSHFVHFILIVQDLLCSFPKDFSFPLNNFLFIYNNEINVPGKS